jgi:hypothetical protein
VDDFVQRIQELAPRGRHRPVEVFGERVTGAGEIQHCLQGTPPRVSSNKLNPFNIFQEEMKRDQNLELRTGRPAPDTAGINKGRPVFTGAYQKDLAEKYKPRQADFQHQAKERNEAPPDKVEKGSAHRKLIKKAHAFSGELSSHGAHHIIMIVPHSALPAAFKTVSYCSDGYGQGFARLMETDGWSITRFAIMCRGGDLLAAALQKPAQHEEEVLNRDRLRGVVRDNNATKQQRTNLAGQIDV